MTRRKARKVMRFEDNLTLVLKTRIARRRDVLRTASKRVGLTTQSTRTVSDLKVEAREKFGPTRLTTVEGLGFHEILQVSMICDDLDRISRSFQFWAPFFKATYDREEFLVVDFVVAFSRGESL